MAQENIAKFVTDPDAIKKIIYVPGKILNVVAPPAEEVRRDVRRPACHGNADSYIPRAQRRLAARDAYVSFLLRSLALFYDARRAHRRHDVASIPVPPRPSENIGRTDRLVAIRERVGRTSSSRETDCLARSSSTVVEVRF